MMKKTELVDFLNWFIKNYDVDEDMRIHELSYYEEWSISNVVKSYEDNKDSLGISNFLRWMVLRYTVEDEKIVANSDNTEVTASDVISGYIKYVKEDATEEAMASFKESVKKGNCQLINKNWIGKDLVNAKDVYADIEQCHVFTEAEILKPYLEEIKGRIECLKTEDDKTADATMRIAWNNENLGLSKAIKVIDRFLKEMEKEQFQEAEQEELDDLDR